MKNQPRSSFLFLWLALGLLVTAFLFDFFFNRSEKLLYRYTVSIENHLHRQEAEAAQLFQNFATFIDTLAATPPLRSAKIQNYLALQTGTKFGLFAYQKDSLFFWSDEGLLPVKIPPADSLKKPIINSYGTTYELVEQNFPKQGISLRCLLPIRYATDGENHRQGYFAADADIAANVSLSTQPTASPIRNQFGTNLTYLYSDGKVADAPCQIVLFTLFMACFFFFGWFMNRTARRLKAGGPAWFSAAFVVVGVFGVRLLMLFFGWSNHFDTFEIFAKSPARTYPAFSASLGDLLINIVLLFWIMLFFYREYRVRTYSHLPRTAKIFLSALYYYSMVLGILMVAGVFKSLVLDSAITFDLDNVFNLDRFSLLAVGGVVILVLTLFLFSHNMMSSITTCGLTKYERLLPLFLSLLAAVPVVYVLDLHLPTPFLLLVSFAYLVLLDYFSDLEQPSLTWLVIWLLIFSFFSATTLFKYGTDKDKQLRSEYAQSLASLRDTFAELDIKLLSKQLAADSVLTEILTPPFPFQPTVAEVRNAISTRYRQLPYVANHYDYTFFIYNQYGVTAVRGQMLPVENLQTLISNLQPASDTLLRCGADAAGNPLYLLSLSLRTRTDDGDGNVRKVFLKFSRTRRTTATSSYIGLLTRRPFKNLKLLEKYDYAIYRDGICTEQNEQKYADYLDPQNLPPLGTSAEIVRNGRSEVIYRAEDGSVAMVGKPYGGLIKPISLFSYLFSLLVLAVGILIVLNTYFDIIPGRLSLFIPSRPTLRNRIQLSVIVLIIVSFVAIGLVTVFYFSNSSASYQLERVERVFNLVVNGMEHEIGILGKQNPVTTESRIEILNALSKIHRTDLQLYDMAGTLEAGADRSAASPASAATLMNGTAFHHLTSMGYQRFVQPENVGGVSLRSAYAAIRNLNDGKTVAFLRLPYYPNEARLLSDISDFIGTLLNVYVFLLLIAVPIAIGVANSITNPLAVISDKLKQFKLGKRNEPLVWNSQDEVGELITEYNLMIQKMEEGAELLAQSERESAWRDMAKQVAHEIKNPLTPMKLSIQYLLHAYRSDPDNIEPLLKRVSNTLVEQIDNLSQIASEFSTFAQMPRADNQRVAIKDLVVSTYDLFRESNNADVRLHVEPQDLWVFVDKNHLLRVLSNLLKNALQSVPSDRRGEVHIHLYQSAENAVIKVSDNGVGIPADMLDKVFKPYFTTKGTGTGLGLPISKNIIETVGGKLYFETQADKGTDFYIELPLIS